MPTSVAPSRYRPPRLQALHRRGSPVRWLLSEHAPSSALTVEAASKHSKRVSRVTCYYWEATATCFCVTETHALRGRPLSRHAVGALPADLPRRVDNPSVLPPSCIEVSTHVLTFSSRRTFGSPPPKVPHRRHAADQNSNIPPPHQQHRYAPQRAVPTSTAARNNNIQPSRISITENPAACPTSDLTRARHPWAPCCARLLPLPSHTAPSAPHACLPLAQRLSLPSVSEPSLPSACRCPQRPGQACLASALSLLATSVPAASASAPALRRPAAAVRDDARQHL